MLKDKKIHPKKKSRHQRSLKMRRTKEKQRRHSKSLQGSSRKLKKRSISR
jgi:hypothetical protein